MSVPSPMVTMQLPRQRPFLHGHVEEEHADILASHTFPSCCRTGHSTETGQVQLRPRSDDEELAVAHGRHGESGETALEGSAQRGLEGESGLPVAVAASTQNRFNSLAHLRGREHGGGFGQRLRLDAQGRTTRRLLFLAGDDHLVGFGLSMQW